MQYAEDFTPVLYYFLPTLHQKICTSPPEMERKEERNQAQNPTVEVAAQGRKAGISGRKRVEKEGAALKEIWGGNSEDSLTERHETPEVRME